MGLSYHYCIIIIIHVNDMQNIYAAYKMHIHKLAICNQLCTCEYTLV